MSKRQEVIADRGTISGLSCSLILNATANIPLLSSINTWYLSAENSRVTLKLRTAFLFSSLYASCLFMSSTVLWRLSSNQGESLLAQFLHRFPSSSLRFPKSPIFSPQISQFFLSNKPIFIPPSKSKIIYVIFSPICQRILLQSNPLNLHCLLCQQLLLHHPDCQQM